MRSRSRQASHRLGQRWGSLRPAGDDHGREMANEIFLVADTMYRSGSLRRVLVDSLRSLESRQRLVETIFADKISSNVLELVRSALEESWAEDIDLPAALEYVGTGALIRQARGRGELGRLEEELFGAVRVFRALPDVRKALEDHYGYPVEARVKLVNQLFQNTTPEALVLIGRAVRDADRHSLTHTLRELGDRTAELSGSTAVTVYSATELTEAQIKRLSAALARYYGEEVSVHVSVEPGLIGGLRIHRGAEVLDASLLHRMKNVSANIARISTPTGKE